MAVEQRPLGTELADAKGWDLRTVTVPKEIPEFTEALHPRGHHVFFGALDPAKLTFAERSLRKLPAARAALPEGDFRDWPEIDDSGTALPANCTRSLSAAHPDAGPVAVWRSGAHGAWPAADGARPDTTSPAAGPRCEMSPLSAV